MKIKRTKSGQLKTEDFKSQQPPHTNGNSENSSSRPSSPIENGITGKLSLVTSANTVLNTPRGGKVDAGTITDASTLTEPENLGPCEPGTSVNLEGIVWHETDSGVLVVNITWRGKTYVGTLLDCTRHTNQWSAPRFTDSPEPGSKGRAKRNRNSLTPADLEPRKNLRSSKAKGKGKKAQNNGSSGSDEFNFPAPSSPAKDSGKRKSRPDDSEENKKRKRTGSESDEASGDAGDDGDQSDDAPADTVAPRRDPKPPQTYSYKMLECPRKDCSKQYKQDDGLRWHLSHSHPEFIDNNGDIKDAATVEKEEQERRRKARLLKEERRQKENRATSDNGEKHPKHPKLDLDKAACGSPKSSSKPGTPTSSKPGTPQLAPVSLPLAKVTPASSQPPVSSRLPGQLPAGLIAPNMKTSVVSSGPVKPAEVTPLLEDLKKQPETPRLPPLDAEKPPANSPAYSDISDDGEPETALTKAPAPPPPGAKALPPKSSSLTPFGLPLAPDPLVSGLPTSLPLARPGSVPPPGDPRVSTPSSLPSPSQRPPTFSSPSVGPSPGTPEYHKYLAANGFPPFPYPYPVGMDPNYHVQLLKTDLIYKAKWEKDRAERERAFKEELDKDQGRYSGLSLLKDDHPKTGASSLPSTPGRPQSQSSNRLPEDLRKREPSGDRSKSSPSPVISVKAEFREAGVKKEVVKTEEGVKPTMETRGPPPGPQTFGYMHPGMVRPPYSLGLHPPFDPIMTSSLAPFGLPGAGPNPYLSSIRPPPGFTFPGDPMRSPFPSLPSPEDLMRSGAGLPGLPGLPGAPPGLSGTKALDLLQQHASQYYANQKLAELQERALKSPSQSLASLVSSHPAAPPVSKAITTMAGKQSPSPVSSASSDKSKSPPPLRHVHTHTHTHIGLGYPLLPPVPGALPSVPGGLPPGALPPPSVGVVPASFTAGSYPGKSP